jgi:hypothetical protein
MDDEIATHYILRPAKMLGNRDREMSDAGVEILGMSQSSRAGM